MASTLASNYETVGIVSKSHSSQLRVVIARMPKQAPYLAVQRWERSSTDAFAYRPGTAGIPTRLVSEVASLLIQGRALIEGGQA